MGELQGPLVVGGFVTALRSDTSQVEPRFLYRWFISPRTQAVLRSFSNKTTSISNLSLRLSAQMPVPLPPFEEQRRIAGILDQADTIRTKRRQVLAHIDTLIRSIFHDMFGELKADGRTVGSVAEIQGGLQVSSKRVGLPVEVPYLRVANVYRGQLNLSEIKNMRATEAEVERTRLEQGDLLFVEGHANPQEVGRVAIWNCEIPLCVHQNHLIRGRLDDSMALPIFAESWLNTDRGAQHFRRAGKTTSGLNTISAVTVRSAPLPLPPMAEQRRFAARVEHVDAPRAVMRRALGADNELFASLQARAFRGEL